MLKKICPNCQKPSYSADDIYTWICPYCGKDITEVKAKPVGIIVERVDEDEGGGYIAIIPELGCVGDGNTVEEAVNDVKGI